MFSIFFGLKIPFSNSLSYERYKYNPYIIVAAPKIIIISPYITDEDIEVDVTDDLDDFKRLINNTNLAITNPKPIRAIPVLIHAKKVLSFARWSDGLGIIKII